MVLTTEAEALADPLYQHGFHVLDDFLPLAIYHDLQQICKNYHDTQRFTSAKIGREDTKKQQSNIRNDALCWLEKTTPSSAIQTYFAALEDLRKSLNQSLFLGLTDVEAHFASYQPQQFYKKHIDQFANNRDRRISCVYYLNEQWQDTWGGELKLYDAKSCLLKVIQPIGNRFVFFKSDILHEVCTTARERYSIAAWFKVRSSDFCMSL